VACLCTAGGILQLRKSMEKDTVNAGNFDNIDASLFALCLDDYASELDLDKAHRNLFHGQKARNRWFDKAMQFIVENNGRAGVNGEVSSRFCDADWSFIFAFGDPQGYFSLTLANGSNRTPILWV
jgi:hypothetical protein